MKPTGAVGPFRGPPTFLGIVQAIDIDPDAGCLRRALASEIRVEKLSQNKLGITDFLIKSYYTEKASLPFMWLRSTALPLRPGGFGGSGFPFSSLVTQFRDSVSPGYYPIHQTNQPESPQVIRCPVLWNGPQVGWFLSSHFTEWVPDSYCPTLLPE